MKQNTSGVFLTNVRTMKFLNERFCSRHCGKAAAPARSDQAIAK
jgi:hypothetical protein